MGYWKVIWMVSGKVAYWENERELLWADSKDALKAD